MSTEMKHCDFCNIDIQKRSYRRHCMSLKHAEAELRKDAELKIELVDRAKQLLGADAYRFNTFYIKMARNLTLASLKANPDKDIDAEAVNEAYKLLLYRAYDANDLVKSPRGFGWSYFKLGATKPAKVYLDGFGWI